MPEIVPWVVIFYYYRVSVLFKLPGDPLGPSFVGAVVVDEEVP